MREWWTSSRLSRCCAPRDLPPFRQRWAFINVLILSAIFAQSIPNLMFFSPLPGPVSVLLPGQSGVPGKLWSLCNINPVAVSRATSHLVHLSYGTRLRCVSEDFRRHTQSEGGPSAYPRNSTSNWAIATYLTRVSPSTLSPNTPIGQSEDATSTTVSISILDQMFDFYSFQCFCEHPDCFTLFGCGTFTLTTTSVASPTYIKDLATVFSCHRFDFFIPWGLSGRSLRVHLRGTLWTERTGTFEHQRIANRRLKTQSTQY